MTTSTTSGYEICHLNQANHLHIAAKEAATYAVSLSGGLASAVSAERVIQRYGRENTLLRKYESSSTASSSKPRFLWQSARGDI